MGACQSSTPIRIFSLQQGVLISPATPSQDARTWKGKTNVLPPLECRYYLATGDCPQRIMKRFWRIAMIAIVLSPILAFYVASVVFHPIHTGMTSAGSQWLCWKALFCGPFAGYMLPCVPDEIKRPGVCAIAVPAIAFATSIVLLCHKKVYYASIALCMSFILWCGTALGYLLYWK